jgi:hypothetical protein
MRYTYLMQQWNLQHILANLPHSNLIEVITYFTNKYSRRYHLYREMLSLKFVILSRTRLVDQLSALLVRVSARIYFP